MAQKRPSDVSKPIMNMGTVAARVAVRLSAKKNSFQAKMAQMNTVATRPGVIIGRATPNSSWRELAPSTRQASRTPSSTSRLQREYSLWTAVTGSTA